ncbi:hypothetical protein [Arthrobacter sp. TMN-50]
MTEDEQSGRSSLPTSDEVVTALRDAGWLLEQDTAAAVEKAGFYVATGKAFPDPDDPSISREIDVHGYRQLFRSEELTFTVSVRILAECKQSSMPYVIVGGPTSPYDLSRPRKEQQFRFPTIETGRTPLGDGRTRIHTTQAQQYLGLTLLPGNPWEAGFLGSQLTRLDRKKTWLADNRGIFTSLVYPLAKSLTYFRSQSNKTSYVMHKPGQEWASIEFYYPLVVTSAPIFAVDTTEREVKAMKVSWATITREIKSTKIDGQFNIDVVTSSALEQYLAERVNLFADGVAELAKKDPQRFVTHEDLNYQ